MESTAVTIAHIACLTPPLNIPAPLEG